MTTPTLITSNPITDEQKDRILRLAEDAAKKIIKNLNLDNPSAQRVIMRWDEVTTAMSAKMSEVSLDPEATTSEQKRAREIMGHNFLGIEEVAKHYGMAFNPEQLTALASIPFSEATFKECKDTHLLVAGFPMTILEIRAKAPKKPKTFYAYNDAWYNNEKFAANERVGVRWYLICKTAVRDSLSKTFDEQQRLIDPKDEVPRACEFVYAIVLNFLATGERLFENVYVRCIDLDSDGRRVFVGRFGSDGLHVPYYYWGDLRLGGLGVASARKFE